MSGQLLKGVSHADYQADELPGSPHLSRGTAVNLLQASPLRAWTMHPKLGGAKEEAGNEALLDGGALIHTILLGAGPGLAVIDANDWRTNAAKAERDEARSNGLLPVLRGKYEAALQTVRAIGRSLERYGIELGDFESELTALWESAGVACKARLDLLSLGRGEIYDLKVQDQVSLRSFEWGIVPYGLDIQAAAYTEAIETLHPPLAGRITFRFLLVEKQPPHDVAIVPLAPAYIDLGAQKWRRARALWKRCLESDSWPGLGRQAAVTPRPFQLEEEFTQTVAAAGDPAWLKEEGAADGSAT